MIPRYQLEKNLGKNVKRLRLAHNWSATGLASTAGVSFKTIYSIEAGEHLPQFYVLYLVATALGASIDQLISNENLTGSSDKARFGREGC